VTPEYVYDPGLAAGIRAAQALERLFDPASRHFIETLGIAPGWRCLEVALRSALSTGWPTALAPAGHVVATDLNPGSWQRSSDTVEVRRYDLVPIR